MAQEKHAPIAVKRGLALWHQIEVLVAVIAFSLIALLLIYDVFAREALIPLLSSIGIDGRPFLLYGSQKIAVFLLIIGAFTGIGIATWSGAQLVPKVGHHIVPARWNISANRIADLITFAFLLGVTVVAAIFVYDTFLSGQRGSTGVRIEVWKIQIAIPLGFGSAAIRYLAFAIWPDLRPQEEGGLE